MFATRLALALFALSAIAPATTVVVLWTPNHAIIGVDGRSTSVTNGKKRHAVACKAIDVNSVVYVVDGFAGFDIRSILENGGSPSDQTAAARMRELIRRALSSALPGIQREDRARYAQLISGTNLFTLYTAWAENGSAFAGITQFFVTPDGQSVDSQTKRWDSVDVRAGMVFWNAVKRSPHPFRDDWLKSDHVQTAKEALKKLVADDPDSGPPLTLIRVTAAGIEWLDRGACEPDGSNALRDERQSGR